MYKKIKIIILFFIIISLYMPELLFSACQYDPDTDLPPISSIIGNCVRNSAVVNPSGNIDLGNSGFRDVMLGWVKSISLYLSIGAVFSIVYGSLLFTISAGEDEKIKKGKDLIKWGILGFLAVVFASVIISVVINFIYSLS